MSRSNGGIKHPMVRLACVECKIYFYKKGTHANRNKSLSFCSIDCRQKYVAYKNWIEPFRMHPFNIEFYEEENDVFGIPFILAYRVYKQQGAQ